MKLVLTIGVDTTFQYTLVPPTSMNDLVLNLGEVKIDGAVVSKFFPKFRAPFCRGFEPTAGLRTPSPTRVEDRRVLMELYGTCKQIFSS
ncbi:hypothetical protein PoB_001366800 [Plakobranchus ocellatus]|uniref:Uncharacterized protein n=1 Tax=Plakobranchus ocellatus TaxID=259542 RepID=A0AAV3YXP8_9GAST|nr:hypothetical protein PoB_001366800 [Plakobranchus ocellatus]